MPVPPRVGLPAPPEESCAVSAAAWSSLARSYLSRGRPERLRWRTPDLAPTGSVTTFATSRVRRGIDYVRVRAANGAGTSGPSNEVTVTVP